MARYCIRRTPWARLRTTALASLLALAAAQTSVADVPKRSNGLAQILSTLRDQIATVEPTDGSLRAHAALKLASEGKLSEASKAINEAVQLDARNSYFHFFNGFVYHLQSLQGDTDKSAMAIEGYRQAVRFDPSNWIAHEFLGFSYWEQRRYKEAQAAFAEVVLSRPQDSDARLRLLAASYMAGDVATACSMADQLNNAPNKVSTVLARTRALVYASCGEFDSAIEARKVFSDAGASAGALAQLDTRIENWRTIFKAGRQAPQGSSGSDLVKTQFGSGSGSPPGGSSGSPFGSPGSGSPFGSPGSGSPFGSPGGGMPGQFPGGDMGGREPRSNRMVLVDVVMVRTEDSISTSKGVNLLSALSLQFGSTSGPAFSRVFTESATTPGSTVVTRAITVPALAYSLNLANANSNLNEVLARPTLAAVDGMRSEFFSGTSLNAAVVSSGSAVGGSAVSIEKKYGVRLSVQPQILADGMVRLTIDASRTFLKPPSANIGFTYKLEISEIVANANVVMRMGDTLILGGLSEKESTSNRDGVPVLQDVPLVQYLFSQQAKTDFQRSVLILITPRAASYSWLSEETRAAIAAADPTPFTPSLDVLRARYTDWFKPYPNLASVFHHLNSADLYREFRTGDVTLESWDRMKTTPERLKQALEFLHY